MDVEQFIQTQRVARLATVSAGGQPHLVPVVYAYDGAHIFIALDEKLKRVATDRLQRVRNITANPHVSLLIDHYDEDWTQLAWVRLDGIAEIMQSGEAHARAIQLLREKYPQYQTMRLAERPLIKITVQHSASWKNRV